MDVWLTNWHKTGLTIPVDQYEVDITLEWVDGVGVAHAHSQTVKVPNIFAAAPPAWLKDQFQRMALDRLRKMLGDV